MSNIVNKKLNDAFLTSIGEAHLQNIDKATQGRIDFDMTEMNLWFEDFNTKAKLSHKKDITRRYIHNILKFSAIILITVAVTFTGLFAGVEAFRIEFLNLIISDNETHTLIDNGNLSELREQGVVLPFALPEGVTLYSYEKIGNMHKTILNDGQGHFINILQADIETQIQFDSEDVSVKYFTLENLNVTYIEKDNVYSFYWYDDSYNYSIVSDFHYETLVNLIKSMK